MAASWADPDEREHVVNVSDALQSHQFVDPAGHRIEFFAVTDGQWAAPGLEFR